MNKSIPVIAQHLGIPINFTLHVSISDLEISELIKSKAKAKARLLGFKEPISFGSIQDVHEQLNLEFESPVEPNPLTGSYTSYTPPERSNTDQEVPSESEQTGEECSETPSDISGSYTPYSTSQELPPNSYHDSLRGTQYVPYRSFVVPVELS